MSYRKEYYQRNREKEINSAVNRAKQLRQRNCQFVMDYLRQHPCLDCGEDNPLLLDFDHQGNKEFQISEMIRRRFSLEKLQVEMDKCEVVCSNCHRLRTADQFGWHRLLC